MCALRSVVSLTLRRGQRTVSFNSVTVPPLLRLHPVMALCERSAHAQKITDNLQYISDDDLKLKADVHTMNDTDRRARHHVTDWARAPAGRGARAGRPLCVLMNWMMARPNHVRKYAELYLERGFDVLSVCCTPWQLMWPARGSQMVGAELLKFLEANDHNPLVVHGFSVGAYVWSELLVLTTYDKDRYQPVLDRIGAQVWDSGADIHEIPVGFPSAVFPTNKFLQETFRSYIKTHMKVFHNVATKHYMKATDVFHATPCRAPGLFLVSKSDPVGAAHRSRDVHDSWVRMGIKCNFKCWDKSPHVSHFIYHPKEYRDTLYAHLEECGVIRSEKSDKSEKSNL